MLDALSARAVAFWQEGLGPTCITCAKKKLGSFTVELMLAGCTRVAGWDPMSHAELLDRVHDAGEQDSHDPECNGTTDENGACVDCACESCWDCGEGLGSLNAEGDLIVGDGSPTSPLACAAS